MNVPVRATIARLALAATLSCWTAFAAATSDEQPIDVLRTQIAAGLAVLTDPAYADPARHAEQQTRLCEIANDMVDVHTFSRLVLMASWTRMSADEQDEFVSVFGEFLCRYYLSRLQIYYANEQITFADQEFRSKTRARVTASVVWRGTEIPFEVRMVYREGRWRAFDIAVSGVSAVLVYRVQFQPLLLNGTPRALIDELRQRIADQG
jgi:phospholipid transport system substrate-binding protein